jgi:hypothetical protein
MAVILLPLLFAIIPVAYYSVEIASQDVLNASTRQAMNAFSLARLLMFVTAAATISLSDASQSDPNWSIGGFVISSIKVTAPIYNAQRVFHM